jgi:hypothetical protein
MKHWYTMFGIFPRYYITYNDSMRRFSIFWIFLNHLWLNFKYRSNSWRPPCVLVGCPPPKFGMCYGFPHLQGTSRYFPSKFSKCSLCGSSSNLHLNGFSTHIIQYMAVGQENSWNPGSCLPTRSPIFFLGIRSHIRTPCTDFLFF